MVEEEPNILKVISPDIKRAIFIERDSVTILRPEQSMYRYYELNDLQFNVYTAKVREETEKDKLQVAEEKKTMLKEINQRLQADNRRSWLI